MTTEEYIQLFITELEHKRDAQWQAGDVVVAALQASARASRSPSEARKRRAGVFRTFSQGTHKSVSQIRQLAETAAAFPPGSPEREGELPWSKCRAAVSAARRLQRPVSEIIDKVLADDLSTSDLAQLGRGDGVATVALKRTCGECSASVAVSIRGDFRGMRMRCPFCAARLEDDGADPRERAAIVGVLG